MHPSCPVCQPNASRVPMRIRRRLRPLGTCRARHPVTRHTLPCDFDFRVLKVECRDFGYRSLGVEVLSVEVRALKFWVLKFGCPILAFCARVGVLTFVLVNLSSPESIRSNQRCFWSGPC